MATKLNKIITLSTDNFNTLKNTGSVTINGTTLSYDDTGATLYLTPDDGTISVERLDGLINPKNLPTATAETPGIVKIEYSSDTAASVDHDHDSKYVPFSGGQLSGPLHTCSLVPLGAGSGDYSIGNDKYPYKYLYINSIRTYTSEDLSGYGPGENGQVLMSDGTNTYWGNVSTQFKLISRQTLSANQSFDISSYVSQYNELMIIVRTVVGASTKIGVCASNSTSSSFTVSTDVTGTTYTKILINLTDEGNCACDVGTVFGWGAANQFQCIKNYCSTSGASVSMTVVIHGR